MTRRETLNMWILYKLKDGRRTKQQIVDFLDKTFKPTYMPVLSEFHLSLGMDFDAEFKNLMEPMLQEKWLFQEDQFYILTKEGGRKVDSVFKGMRFHQNQ